jgi:hypothetical protein
MSVKNILLKDVEEACKWFDYSQMQQKYAFEE